MRLINADALIGEMHNVILEDGEDRRTFYEVIERQPTIEERKTGHWIDEEGSPFYCSECGRYQYNNTLDIMQGDYKFCPYCGADMRGV